MAEAAKAACPSAGSAARGTAAKDVHPRLPHNSELPPVPHAMKKHETSFYKILVAVKYDMWIMDYDEGNMHSVSRVW